MEKIDLTKCNNCRFRAKISNSGPVSGRIVVDKGVYLVDEKGNFIGFLSLDGEEIMSMSGCGITDFEIVPRDPETYKDWQVGDRARNPRDNWSDSAYKEIIFRSGELVICKDGNGDISGGYTCGQLHRLGYRLVLTDIEQKIIEGKKKYKPQEGDVCFVKTAAGNCFIFIKRDHKPDEKILSYACLNTTLQYLCPTKVSCVCDRKSIRELRPATDEEKQKLFDAMSKQGKRWNAEKKVVEDIPKPYEFKKGEPVLVRDNGCVWKIGVFTEMRSDYFQHGAMTNGLDECGYHYCLPYNERTMHLLGTAADYKEE